MLIEREVHIDAPMRHVVAECERCPCPTALSVAPEGSGTRLRVHAEVTPDDLAEFVESQLVQILRTIRQRLDHRPRHHTDHPHTNHQHTDDQKENT